MVLHCLFSFPALNLGWENGVGGAECCFSGTDFKIRSTKPTRWITWASWLVLHLVSVFEISPCHDFSVHVLLQTSASGCGLLCQPSSRGTRQLVCSPLCHQNFLPRRISWHGSWPHNQHSHCLGETYLKLVIGNCFSESVF